MGYGDAIMASGFARLAKQQYPNLQIVIGNRKKMEIYDSEMFNNNPNITKSCDVNPSINKVWIEHYPGNCPYWKAEDNERIYWNLDYRSVRGDLFFDNEEMNIALSAYEKINKAWYSKFGRQAKKIVFIEPSRKIKEIYSNSNLVNTRLGELNRDWGVENWQKLINLFQDEILFIQSAYTGSKKFNGVFEYDSDFRTACAMMSLCDAFIGWEGGFAHAAASLKKKAVVLFGGWIHPNTTGYEDHNNIYIDIEGSPCGMRNYCEHCNKCRDLISVEKVSTSLESIF